MARSLLVLLSCASLMVAAPPAEEGQPTQLPMVLLGQAAPPREARPPLRPLRRIQLAPTPAGEDQAEARQLMSQAGLAPQTLQRAPEPPLVLTAARMAVPGRGSMSITDLESITDYSSDGSSLACQLNRGSRLALKVKTEPGTAYILTFDGTNLDEPGTASWVLESVGFPRTTFQGWLTGFQAVFVAREPWTTFSIHVEGLGKHKLPGHFNAVRVERVQ